jgi:hypothetical protein
LVVAMVMMYLQQKPLSVVHLVVAMAVVMMLIGPKMAIVVMMAMVLREVIVMM